MHDKEHSRNDEVTTHQSKAEWVIGLIQPVKQKLQFITQSLEEGPSKHISFDCVEHLAKQVEEIEEEFSWVQQILKEF